MQSYPEIKKRVFIVGCPRSGTTLLQGMLTSHSEIFSLPETLFFAKAISKSPIKRHLLWPSLKARVYLPTLIKQIGHDELLPLCKIGIFDRNYHVPFVKIMDKLTLDAGKKIWVEKTPFHIHFIKEIQDKIPDAEIIHIVRNGIDVVPSMIAATRKFPEEWIKHRTLRPFKWKGYTVDEAVNIWNEEFSISKSFANKPGNTIVKYEDLVENPLQIAIQLSELLSIKFEEGMIDPSRSFKKIVREDEPWKKNNAYKIGERSTLTDNIASEAEINSIKSKLVDYDI